MKTDIEIAQAARIRPIAEVAAKLGLREEDLELYGKYKAKLPLSIIDEKKAARAKLILVECGTLISSPTLAISNLKIGKSVAVGERT